ncbi:MAG: HEAT repeat domain-containing protein [Planctomycetota bacterium]|jgi:hypothetical protein
MRTFGVLAGVACFLALPPVSAVAAVPPPTVFVQDDEEEEVPDEREEVEELLDELKPLLKDRKGVNDPDAIGLIDQLLGEFPVSGPKDKKSIVEGVGDCLSVRRSELDDGSPNQALQRAAAVALGRMGPESQKVLVDHIDHKALRDADAAHADVLRSVGRVQAPKGVKKLMDMLECGNYGIEAAAAQGLGMYLGLDSDDRKEIFEKLLKTIMPLQQVIEQGDTTGNTYDEVRARYDTIGASIRESMSSLSGHEERDFNAWRQWWNDNRRRDWVSES